MTEQQQEEVLAFLQGGALGKYVERIDTHGAVVLLAGERAYKLKRAVRFSFMDFSTLDLREAALRRELELNRRTAPMLYRRVLPVTREPDGSLALDGDGRPAEWLLEMSRFAESAQLDRVAARGELTEDLAEALALTIDKFQRQSQTPVEFIQHGQGHLRAPEQQLQIVFILQEALSNIRKHAKAERVTVTLVNDHDLTLTIADNGVGFDLEQVASEKDGHIGLNIMRERAARLGGSLSLHAVRGEGTQIVLSIANVAAMPAVA